MCPSDIGDIYVLVREVFDQCLAEDFSEEGRAEFMRCIEPEAIRQRLDGGAMALVACVGDRIVGMIEMRDTKHICLCFTATEHQGKGIGKRLLKEAIDRCRKLNSGIEEVTVNSSRYSLNIYRRWGFVETADEQEKKGIRFIPMSLKL
jgi:predicted GNAT family N-acyltransferase